MKKGFCLLLTLTLLLSLLCCTEQKVDNDEILAKINDYELTKEYFESLLVANLQWEEDFMLTKDARRLFLAQLIQKELLVQEAKRLRLDTKKKFIEAIERYWEATLIKNLMDLKGNEIRKMTYVTQEEIETRYEEMKKSGKDLPPLETIAKEIAERLTEEKNNEKLRIWIDSLRNTAKIEINEGYFSK